MADFAVRLPTVMLTNFRAATCTALTQPTAMRANLRAGTTFGASAEVLAVHTNLGALTVLAVTLSSVVVANL